MNRSRLALPFLIATTAGGCTGTEAPLGFTVVDSAGIEIVRSAGPSEPEPRRLDRVELTLDGPPTGFVEVVAAIRLADGRVAVADAGSAMVTYFRPDGTAERSFGGSGDGPGEFRILQGMGRTTADTLWVFDFSHHRFSIVAPDATVTREVTLRPPPGPLLAVGAMAGGGFVLGEAWSSTAVAGASEPGLRRDPVAYLAYAADGALRDTVAVVPGREVVLTSEAGRGVMGSAPLGRTAVHAPAGHAIVVGDQVDHEVQVWSPAGQLIRIVRWEGGPLDVTRDVRDAWLSGMEASVGEAERAPLRRRLGEVELPGRRPAYGDVLGAPDGSFWVAAFAADGGEPARWSVFDASGRWRYDVSVDDRFRPLDVGEDWALGVSRDALDVQRVELRRLRASEGSA